MRIAWFTPFSSGSMVARFSAMVTRELARHADVDIWHPPDASTRAAELRTIAMPRRGVSASMLTAYDLAVYNLGGEEEDGRVAQAACAVPGLAILHGPVPDLATRRAYAVVVHSEFARQFAAGASLARVAVIPAAQEKLPACPGDGRQALGIPDETLLVLATSTGDGRDRLAVLLEALMAVHGDRFTCAVAGPVAPSQRDELERLAGKRVRLIGPISEDVLRPWIAGADICVELRRPALEWAPVLPALFMLHGKPVVVSDAGCYAELREDATVKVGPGCEAGDVERALEVLVSGTAGRRALGRHARRFAEKMFNPQKYAARLLSVAAELLPSESLLRLIETTAARLAEIGDTDGGATVDRVAREVYGLFSDGNGLPGNNAGKV